MDRDLYRPAEENFMHLSPADDFIDYQTLAQRGAGAVEEAADTGLSA